MELRRKSLKRKKEALNERSVMVNAALMRIRNKRERKRTRGNS